MRKSSCIALTLFMLLMFLALSQSKSAQAQRRQGITDRSHGTKSANPKDSDAALSAELPTLSLMGNKVAFILFQQDPKNLLQSKHRLCIAELNTESVFYFPEIFTESGSTHPNYIVVPEQPFFSPDEQRIFFVASTPNYACRSLFSSNLHGNNLQRLCSCDASPINPVLSPNGKYLAFSSLGDFHAHVIDLEGRTVSIFPSDVQESIQSKFTFSPDGQKILYVSYHQIAERFNIYLQDLATGTRTQVAELQKESYPSSFPSASISPDQKTVVFSAPTGSINTVNGKYKDKQYEIFTISLEDGSRARLTNDSNYDTQPQFTPDGAKIVFASYGEEQSGIYIMDLNGRNRRMITKINGVANKIETFSLFSDGTRITFVDHPLRDQSDVFFINMDGTGRTRVRDMLVELPMSPIAIDQTKARRAQPLLRRTNTRLLLVRRRLYLPFQ